MHLRCVLRIHDRIYIYVLDIYSLLSSRLLFFCLYCKISLSHIFVCFHVYVHICVLLSCIGGNKDYLLNTALNKRLREGRPSKFCSVCREELRSISRELPEKKKKSPIKHRHTSKKPNLRKTRTKSATTVV